MSETKIKEIIKPGQPVGPEDLKRLMNTWMETYIGLMLLTSRKKNKALEYMKDKLTEANEAVMGFFDKELKRWKL